MTRMYTGARCGTSSRCHFARVRAHLQVPRSYSLSPPPLDPQAKHIWAPIGPDEYDAAVRDRPDLCPLAATGDRRSGRQLLADAAVDARRTVVGLAGCREGRAELDAIAAAAEHMARA
jgi:hypothetical protein